MKRMPVVTISKKKIQAERGVVILSLREYQRLLEGAVSVEYLPPKEAARLDRLAKQALREHKAGKTLKLSSLADLRNGR